jgi:hypothetical protein
LLVNTPVGVVTARSVTTPVFCPTIFLSIGTYGSPVP